MNNSRTPQGVRGLKWLVPGSMLMVIVLSHPARGAWIEIASGDLYLFDYMSHPARGAWIEMFDILYGLHAVISRTPQGVRGLKYDL